MSRRQTGYRAVRGVGFADAVGRARYCGLCRAGVWFANAGGGLCLSHFGYWKRAGRPDRGQWLATVEAVHDPDHRICGLAYCDLWSESRNQQFCHVHQHRWRQAGRPPLDEFVTLVESQGNGHFDFRMLGDRRQLKLELQYALQCRHDERKVKTPVDVGRAAIAFVATAEVDSLLAWPLQRWVESFTSSRRGQGTELALLRFAYRRVDDLRVGSGWDAVFPTDVWEMRRVGYEGNLRIRFDEIAQLWLRDLAKRHARWRLSIGLSLNTAYRDTLAITRLSAFLALPSVAVTALAEVTRPVLERYLAELRSGHRSAETCNGDVASLNTFFDSIRRHEWDSTLPATAAFYAEDYPKLTKKLPRALAEHIMAQIEQPANLDRWTYPEDRLITVILIRCGMRVGDACRLGFDCIVRDSDGAPYLRYTNWKMKREALVPIDEQVEQSVLDQQHRVLHRWPEGNQLLFPAHRSNRNGRKHWATESYRSRLAKWLTLCEVLDEHARPVHLTPHQWRHTFATRLINHDVPQEVVRRLLDHSTGEMTAHYARLHDTTVRRHWESARKVDATGDTIALDPAGPLAEAQWAKQRLGRATQALPNGYCGLPVQKTCPHANACLTCPMFLTTTEFLPQHRTHRQEVLQIISLAEARGQQRLAEMNHQVLGNLDKIITTLENDTETEESENAG